MSSVNFSTPFFLILASISPLSSLQSLRMPCAKAGPPATIPATSAAMMSLLMLFSLSRRPRAGRWHDSTPQMRSALGLGEQPPDGDAACEKCHSEGQAAVAPESAVGAEIQAADNIVAPTHPQPVRTGLVCDRRIEQPQ